MLKKVISVCIVTVITMTVVYASTIRALVLKENFTDWPTRHSSHTINTITGTEKDIGLWILIGNTSQNEPVRIVIKKDTSVVFEKIFLAGGYANDVIFFNDPFVVWENTRYTMIVSTPTENKEFSIPVSVNSKPDDVTQVDMTQTLVETSDSLLKKIADAIKNKQFHNAEQLLANTSATNDTDVLTAALLDAYFEEYDFEGALRACVLLRRTSDGEKRSEIIFKELNERETLKENATHEILKRYYRMKRLIDEKNTLEVLKMGEEYPVLASLFSHDIAVLKNDSPTRFPYVSIVLLMCVVLIIVYIVHRARPDYLKKGLSAYQDQNFKVAADCLEKYIKKTQSVDVSIYRRLAEIYVKLDDFDRAIEVYKQCDALLHVHTKEA